LEGRDRSALLGAVDRFLGVVYLWVAAIFGVHELPNFGCVEFGHDIPAKTNQRQGKPDQKKESKAKVEQSVHITVCRFSELTFFIIVINILQKCMFSSSKKICLISILFAYSAYHFR